jgi:hypothetical protein
MLGLNYDFSAPGQASNVVRISREDEGWISGIGSRQHGFLTWCSLCTTPEQVTKYGNAPTNNYKYSLVLVLKTQLRMDGYNNVKNKINNIHLFLPLASQVHAALAWL